MKRTGWISGSISVGTQKGTLVALLGLAVLAGCEKKEIILPGAREELRAVLQAEVAAENAVVEVENRTLPLQMAAQTNNANWLQRFGTPATRTNHPALGRTLTPLWNVSIGASESRKARISADPVVANGRIFTLDSAATVQATSTAGAAIWTRDLVPARDTARDASGGGLAFGDGKLFVSSGFGLMTALDPASGEILWQQKLQASATGSPTYADGKVFLVAGDSLAWALDADNGRIAWQLSASPDINNVFGGPAPVVAGDKVVFAFGSGEMQAAIRNTGARQWDSVLSGQRRGYARAKVSDITGDPVVVGSTLYAGSHSGRLASIDLNSGTRLWTVPEGPLNPVWPAGDSIFLVSDRNELLRLATRDGARIWGVKLPFFVKDRPKRQKEVFAHYGPVLAGGRLVVASNDGLIRSFDPTSGDLLSTVEIPGGATTNPVIAGGTLYVVSTKGQLHAFR
ncbi:MAG: PQQ-binding-like beta-propeller repeat protein [Rhodobacterales bacterium]|nr:PQQ-binding-like beta-propeller repeat protein [Rhodobacterales bacterium]